MQTDTDPWILIKKYKYSLIIILVGIVVYFNSLFNNFVSDDFPQIVENLPIHSIGNIFNFLNGSTFNSGGSTQLTGVYYKPLLSSYFSLIYSIFGTNYSLFHFFQISVHVLNAYLVFVFFKYFFKKPLALILSLVFLVHPINSEAVFFISAMQEPLFFLFGMIGLLLLQKMDSKKTLALVSLCFFLSLLSKETGILFIAVGFLYTFLFKKKYLFSLFAYSMIVLAGYLILRIHAISIFTHALVFPIDTLTLLQRAFNMPAIFFFYVKTFVFPINLAYSYHWVYKTISFNHFFLPLIIDFLCIGIFLYVAAILYKKSEKYFSFYLFFLFWFLSGIFLHLQIIPLDATVADRWFYFPIMGLLGMIGILLEKFIKIRWVILLIGLLVTILSIRTIMRGYDWKDELILASHDVTLSDSYLIKSELGYELSQHAQFEKAIYLSKKSVDQYPTYVNYLNLGAVYFNQGNSQSGNESKAAYQKAKEAYLHALTLGVSYKVFENLTALAIVSQENSVENITIARYAVKKYPYDTKLWLALAVLEYRSKNTNNAKIAIEQAYYYNNTDSTISTIYEIIMNNKPLDIKF